MSTIKGVGNKLLQHTNSVTSLPNPSKLPRYGVVTAHEEELGAYLGGGLHSITRWGINVFKISELSNNRPLTAVTYTVFHERDLMNVFKIPPTSLLALLLTLEEHYLRDVPYHNSTHAADVTLSMNALLNSEALEVRKGVQTADELNVIKLYTDNLCCSKP
jgi:cAMP-specific phosphodiesterase 4